MEHELYLIRPGVGPHMVTHVPTIEWQSPGSVKFPSFDKLKRLAAWPQNTTIELAAVPGTGWRIMVDEDAAMRRDAPPINLMASAMLHQVVRGVAFLWTGPLRDG